MTGTADRKWLEKLKGLEFPHPLVILFAFVLLAAVATYIIPGGEYERVDLAGRTVVKAGSFRYIAHNPQGLAALVLAPFNGLMSAAEIVFLLLIIGGSFGVMMGTGALDAGIHKTAQAMKGREIVMIPALMLLFGLAGGVFGMYEETLPFVAVMVPMAVALGYDSIVGVCIVYLAAVLGFCGAFFNPFTVGIAQGIAGLPLFSGAGYRLFVWAVTLGTGITYTLVYALKIKKNPKASPVYESDEALRKAYVSGGLSGGPDSALTGKRALILGLAALGFMILPAGVIKYQWGIKELAGLFFGLALITWLISGRGNFTKSTEDFVNGACGLVNAALLIGIARGIKIMLEDGRVMDTILYWLSSSVSGFPKLAAVQIMFFVQCVLSCIIQSGSAQAAVSMPLMAPLADLLGITRQTAVLAFQMGDGFANFAIPWTGVTLAVLNLGKVPVWKWFGWAWKLQAILVVVNMLLLIWPALCDWGPF